MKKTSLPRGANVLSSTWVFKIKRYPDGRMRKHKAGFCVRGDCQIKNLEYVESYAPVLSWSTIIMVMNIAAQSGWANRQVYFSNAFIQATLEEKLYVEMPAMFSDKNTNSEETVVLKLSMSFYRLVYAPRTWYQHINKGLNSLKFEPSDLDKAV